MATIGRHLRLFLLIASLTPGLATALAQTNENKDRVVLQLPEAPQFEFAGYYAALSQGYFREEGLDVEIRPGGMGVRPIAEVTGGAAEYGVEASALIVARLRGAPVVLVSSIFQHSSLVLAVLRKSGMSMPADLAGKKVALDPHGSTPEIQAMFWAGGVGPVQFTAVPDQWGVGEIETGAAEAMVINNWQADLDFEPRGVKIQMIRPSDYGVDFYGDSLFTTEAEARNDPERVEAMRRAILRGWRHALENPEATISWLLANRPDPTGAMTEARLRAEAIETTALINANLVSIGHINPERWSRLADLVVHIGLAPDAQRMRGFIFAGPVSQIPRWGKWLFAVFSLALALAVAGFLTNRRLHRLVELRTRELRDSEAIQREYFDLAPAPIVIENYLALEPVLTRFTAEGITDLRRHLRERPELLSQLFKLKRVVAANRKALARTGYKSVEDMDRNLSDVMSAQAMEMFAEELVALWSGVDRLTLEKIYHTKNNEMIHALINWEVGRTGGLRDLANVRLVFTEITELKKAEQALRDSEVRYRELFERAVGGIYRTGPEGAFLTLNPSLARMFGFETPAQMIAWTERNTGAAFYTKAGRREEFVGLMSRHDFVNDFESEVRHSNGSTFWVSENARAVRDNEQRLLYYEGFVTDITARRRLEAEMTRASKLEAVGILAGGIAHDFNNFLTVVLGNLALAEMDTAPGDSIRQMLGNAKKATLRARDLTMQLLTFAKGGDPVRTAIELPELLRESVDFALHGAKARSEFRIAADLWPANADKGQVGQVVQNLVINAVQAMPAGGVVTITAANAVELGSKGEQPPLAPGRYVFISVADTGVGVAAEHLVKIFDPYFTTKKQGSGLGLATVYSIVKKHQGHIEVESNVGQGTTFRLWLPAASEAPVIQVVEEDAPQVLKTRVLFMDDEAPIRDMAMMFMQRIGADCAVAADGAEAVKKYSEALGTNRAFNVVVMDLTVPGGMGGREAMGKLRQIDPAIIAVVSSGYSQDPVLSNYSAHGFRGILPKPYSLDQLNRVLHEVLAGTAQPKVG